MDKRQFHSLLNDMKDAQPESIHLIESIQDAFDQSFDAISDSEKRALKVFPMQFVKRVPLEGQEWTTQLHIWAENSVPEIAKLDPMILAHKNSLGDSILMSLIMGALGSYTEVIDYDLIQSILDTDLSYEDIDGDDKVIEKNALDVKDLNDQTPIDFLIDYAYASGKYKGQEPDTKLIAIIRDFCASDKDIPDEAEETDDVIKPVMQIESDSLSTEKDEEDEEDVKEKEEL
jgi:hypothetical protein